SPRACPPYRASVAPEMRPRCRLLGYAPGAPARPLPLVAPSKNACVGRQSMSSQPPPQRASGRSDRPADLRPVQGARERRGVAARAGGGGREELAGVEHGVQRDREPVVARDEDLYRAEEAPALGGIAGGVGEELQ